MRLLIVALALIASLPSLAAAQGPDRAAGSASAAAAQPAPADVVREIERTVVRVQRSLDSTWRAGRDQHARCVDATLSQITALLRLANERHQRMARYERTRDGEMAARERALIVRLLPRARELEREALRCVEPDVEVGGRTRVVTIIDPDVPTDAVREPRRRQGAVFE